MALERGSTSGSMESMAVWKETLQSDLEEKSQNGGPGRALPYPDDPAQGFAKKRVVYMDSLPCASRSHRSRILMNSISGASSDSLVFDRDNSGGFFSGASRRNAAGLRPAP